MSQVAHNARDYASFCSIKWVAKEYFLFPLDGMLKSISGLPLALNH